MGAVQPGVGLAIEPEVLNSIPSGVAVISRDHRLLYCNHTLAGWLGLRAELYLGRPLTELESVLKSQLVSAEAASSWFRWSGTEADADSREVRLLREEDTLHLRQDSCPWRDPEGNICGRIFLFHDFSREKAIDRRKTEFIAVASHELRTPMTSIKGAVDLVLSGFAGEISPESRELLEIAHNSCDRLIRLINDILDLSKIEAGQVSLKKAPLDLRETVERSIRSVKSYADQFGVKLVWQSPETLPAIEADKDRIEQIITNLLSNAIKFSPENGEVRAELRVDGEWVYCSVTDHGCGIAEQDLPKVFGRFQQVGESRRKGGTGLGLAIAQGLVNEHGGSIWVESRVNEGSCFSFKLPIGTTRAG